MAKKRDILLTVLFCGFIGAMAVLIAFLPKQEVSELKNEHLQNSLNSVYKKLFNGKWEKDFETYISDHFPARNFFASTDSYYMLYSDVTAQMGYIKEKTGILLTHL